MARASQDTERLSIKDSPASDSSTAGGNIMAEVDKSSSESALRDNIERKGKNAYYYAHSHRATGPKWDGKPEPKLLGRTKSSLSSRSMAPSFDIDKSTITSYSFLDEGKKVRLYVDLEGIGEKCSADDSDSAAAAVNLDWSENAMSLTISNYPTEGITRCLSFGRLYGKVERGTVKTKKDRVVVTLVKKKPKEEEKIEVSSENPEDGPGDKEVEMDEWPAIAARDELDHNLL